MIEHYADMIWSLPMVMYFAIGFFLTMGAICAYGTAVCIRLVYDYLSDKVYWWKRHRRDFKRHLRRVRGYGR